MNPPKYCPADSEKPPHYGPAEPYPCPDDADYVPDDKQPEAPKPAPYPTKSEEKPEHKPEPTPYAPKDEHKPEPKPEHDDDEDDYTPPKYCPADSEKPPHYGPAEEYPGKSLLSN